MSEGIGCPKCGHPVSEVIESRQGYYSQWRHRRCKRCHKVFTTTEIPVDLFEYIMNRIGGSVDPQAYAFLSDIRKSAGHRERKR